EARRLGRSPRTNADTFHQTTQKPHTCHRGSSAVMRLPGFVSHIRHKKVPLNRAEECLTVWLTARAVRGALDEFLNHYDRERAHQGLDHQILEPGPEVGRKAGVIVCRERLGGLLKYYHRQAA